MTARDRAAEQILRWADQQEPFLRAAIRDAWRQVQASINVAELLRRLQANDVDGVVQLLLSSPEAKVVEARLRNAYARALQTTRTNAARGFVLRIEAPVADQRMVDLVREWENDAFRRMLQEAREGLREQVATEMARGIGPRQMAVALKAEVGRVGLTAYDERIIASFRRALEEGRTADALGRALRDRRFDRSLLKPLTPAQIDTMVDAYRRKLIAFRAETFARTSALQASNDAALAVWEDAVAQGRVPLEQVRRFWVVAEDERLCPTCAPIPGLNPNGVGLRDSFNTPNGLKRNPVMHPRCRCTVWVRIVRPNVAPRPRPGSGVLILPQIKERTRWVPQPV